MRIKELLTEHGCPLYINSPTNQQFVVLNAAQREALKDRVSCETWEELEMEQLQCGLHPAGQQSRKM